MMKTKVNGRESERGSAGVKFLIVFVVIILAANAGYQFIPVAYAGESLKQEMQTAVVNGMAVPVRMTPVDYVKNRVQKAVSDNNLPSDTLVEVKQVGNVVQAHAAFNQKIPILPFGIYSYNYKFDYTATPAGFLLK
jgi:hypothetical protein